ncbi:MAG TPA: Ig-like domain-containing protein [Gallionella sp.]|nr:Ig-like domain-containing protein [Gallionella sp.]
MNAVKPWQLICAGMVAMLVFCCCGGAQAEVIDAELETELGGHAATDEFHVIVSLSDKVDYRLFQVLDRRHRDTRLFKALKDKSVVTQAEHKAFLQKRGGHHIHELLTINGIAVTARADVIRELASHPGVESIRADSVLQAPAVSFGSPALPQWNLGAVHAQDLWALNHNGTGVVVANMDTGVDPNHPDLAGKWRGGNNSWYDPHGEHAAPFDSSGHGTQTMGIMVGGDVSGTPIGVAPGSSWIAAKIFNDAGKARLSDIHLAFQWMLDPDGNPTTVDAPDVVNASWGVVGAAGQCISEFSADIAALKAAGIAVTFAAGDHGAAPASSLSPANDPQGFASGAVDMLLGIAPFSSRGPSACDGGVFPKMVAPGVNINTADLSSGGLPLYVTVSGTSYAAPHTAGVMALLINAFPNATVSELESALTQSAQDLGVAGPDNSYGYGLVDALAAYQMLLERAGSSPSIGSTPATAAVQGVPYVYAVQAGDPTGSAITFSLDVAPAGMAINATTGKIAWTPGYAQEGIVAVAVRAANARGQAATQAFKVNIARTNAAPVAMNDTYSMVKGSVLDGAAPGVLGNDSDPNHDPLTVSLVQGPSNGTLKLNANGSFKYTPTGGFVGADHFTYRAYDGALYSSDATATITVGANKAPVARNDSVLAPYRDKEAYQPRVISVLDNDFDPDGSLNPASVVIVTKPTRGGTIVVNANGTVSYTPKPYFRGTDVFQYQMADNLGAYSNRATVWVNVY